jgi:hypothetical protein
MPPYEDWNKIDEDEDDELQDTSVSAMNTSRLGHLNPWHAVFRREEGRYPLLH